MFRKAETAVTEEAREDGNTDADDDEACRLGAARSPERRRRREESLVEVEVFLARAVGGIGRDDVDVIIIAVVLSVAAAIFVVFILV